MTAPFKPMLASPADLDKLRYPVYGSPKLDGIRASIVNGRLLSRTLKEIPNRHIYNQLNFKKYEGLDGELIVGDPTSPTCYRDTVSGVMSDGGEPEYTYWVFDFWPSTSRFGERRMFLQNNAAMTCLFEDAPFIRLVEHTWLSSREDLDAYEAEQVGLGYEGIMLNDPIALYKFGRATTKGGELLKVKRFIDSEALVIGMIEEQHNGNEAETNELGRTKRSSAKAGKTGKGTMGALVVRDLKSNVEFEIGTGFTAQDRVDFWQARETHIERGDVVRFKHFPIGAKSRPRHPVFTGMRPKGA